MPEPIITPVAIWSSSVSGCQSASASAMSAAAMPYRMKGSILRCSLGSIQSSALKVPLEPSPTGIRQAIFAGRSSTSNSVTSRAPLWPAKSRSQVTSVPHPRGDTMPVPVITTRLIANAPPLSKSSVFMQRRTSGMFIRCCSISNVSMMAAGAVSGP
ncbi:hypothetical protein D3C86_1370920 [compost metagenome]